MGGVTTHVLDAALGRPATGVAVRLESDTGTVGAGLTDADGRVRELAPADLAPGTYRLVFDTANYHATTGQPSFYPEVCVTFIVADPAQNLHVPLLLSPFAYSTYRGS